MTEEKIEEKNKEIRIGDIVTDPDGSEWRIVTFYDSRVSRVRVGSLAEKIIFHSTDETNRT